MNRNPFVILILFFLFWSPQLVEPQEQEKIEEKVEVVNIEVLVRVFSKGKTVSGLLKENFSLFIDGKETPIHGFAEFKKKVEIRNPESGLFNRGEKIKPRL